MIKCVDAQNKQGEGQHDRSGFLCKGNPVRRGDGLGMVQLGLPSCKLAKAEPIADRKRMWSVVNGFHCRSLNGRRRQITPKLLTYL